MINSNHELTLNLKETDFPFALYYYYTSDYVGDIKLTVNGVRDPTISRILQINKNTNNVNFVQINKSKKIVVSQVPIPTTTQVPTPNFGLTIPTMMRAAYERPGNVIKTLIKDYSPVKILENSDETIIIPYYMTPDYGLVTTALGGWLNGSLVNVETSLFKLSLTSANLPFLLFVYYTGSTTGNVKVEVDSKLITSSIQLEVNTNTNFVNIVQLDKNSVLSVKEGTLPTTKNY